jgi:hypothetical protein
LPGLGEYLVHTLDECRAGVDQRDSVSRFQQLSEFRRIKSMRLRRLCKPL